MDWLVAERGSVSAGYDGGSAASAGNQTLFRFAGLWSRFYLMVRNSLLSFMRTSAVFQEMRENSPQYLAGRSSDRKESTERDKSLGVAQIALGVSIEGSMGSRNCRGRALKRGHGEIS